jgi:glycosyltransferase involved in cell wall biosynthesis
VLLRGGPLVEDFCSVAPTTVVDELAKWSVPGVIEGLLFAARRTAAGFRRRSARLRLRRWRAGDVVYLHSVLSVQILRYLPPDGPFVLGRLTEEAHPLDHPLQPADLRMLLERVDRFLAETVVGAEELLAAHEVAPARVARVPELLVTDHPRLPDRADLRAERRRDLGVAADAVVVGSFGASLVEPPDAMATVWSTLVRRGTDPTNLLLWGRAHTAASFWMEHDLETAQLGGTTRAVDATDLRAVLAACDVAVLSTRAVDYPRAFLELLAAGVPVVCFEGNRLADAVRRTEPADVVPYLDLDAVADRLTALLEQRPVATDGMLAEIDAHHGPEAFARAMLAEAGAAGANP